LSIRSGQTIAHYRLIEKIGEGGMGAVWKAVDTTLDREVAVKFLTEASAREPERLTRFEREARLLATLNHPNIAAIYGLHETENYRFLAMELVSGENLRHRLDRGPLRADAALAICRQLVDALETAHESGVIHRDLKPANIQLAPDGTVKVLDFGLAKAFEERPDGGDPALSPTITSAGSLDGVILGTAAYMSPEQARGQSLDKRTDIWSFGCVLFEMLTGEQCFGGESVSDSLARILEREPNMDVLPADTPAVLHELLHRCLRKNPRQRLRDMGEARIAMEEYLDHPAADRPAEAAERASWRRLLPWAIAILMALIAGGTTWIHLRAPTSAPKRSARLVVNLPPGQQLAMGQSAPLAVSPDGSRLAYVATGSNGRPLLHLRELDRFESISIPGSEGADGPFFSPDSRWVGFFTDKKLLKVSVEGGPPLEICDVAQVVPGASWGPDDTIYFTFTRGSGLVRVPASGGVPEELTSPDFASGETEHGWPKVLPGGESLVFTIASAEGSHIGALSLQTGETRTLLRGSGGARYVSTGHLVYTRAGGMLAVPFDPKNLEITGSPTPVSEDIFINRAQGRGLAAFSVSDDGLLAYVPGGAAASENSLVWVDRQGRTEPLTAELGSYEWPRLSPDGKKVAVANRSIKGEINIWILDTERDTRSRLTLEGSNILPIWTPDGERVAFSSSRSGSEAVSIYWKSADGSGEADEILRGENPIFPRSFSPDGRLLAVTEWAPTSMRNIWMLNIEGDRSPMPVLTTTFDEYAPAFSPDGRWLAYVSDETGRDEVYVRRYPGEGGKSLVSTGGGSVPAWSADGRELFYRNGQSMMAVSVETEPAFRAEKPRLLFEGNFKRGVYDSMSYDASPDGRRFVMVEGTSDIAPDQIKVVLNWFGDLPADGSETVD
jgi:serine/threonine-protein kinase